MYCTKTLTNQDEYTTRSVKSKATITEEDHKLQSEFHRPEVIVKIEVINVKINQDTWWTRKQIDNLDGTY